MRRLVLFCLVLLCFLFVGNLSFAENLIKLDKAYTNDQVMQYLLDNITLYTNKPFYNTTWQNVKTSWETEPDNVVFTYYYNNNASSSNALTAQFYNGNISYNTTTQSAPSTTNLSATTVKVADNLGNSNGTVFYSSYSNYSVKIGNNVNNNYLKYFIYKDDNGNWWQYTNNNNISLENIQTGLDFELASTRSITNYQNDGLYWYFQYMYNNSKWLLGTFSNAVDFSEVEFQVRDSDTDIVIASVFASQTYATNGMSINNGQLFIDNYRIYLNQRYYLEYTCWLNGDIVDYFYYPIVFLNTNAVITNGEITSIGSGESYNVQNSTNDIINSVTSSGDPQLILSNDLFSGDSGDIYSRFGYNDYNNPYKDFILRVFYGIMNTLTTSGNVNLVWPVRDKAIVLHSDDFIHESITFKILLSGILVFFIMYKIYGKLKVLLDELAEGNINYTLNFKDGKFTEYWFF